MSKLPEPLQGNISRTGNTCPDTLRDCREFSSSEKPTGRLSAELGYGIVGPLCYGFAEWVARQAKAAGITQLYFLSRDGWLLKKAFDLLPPEVREGLTSHYLYSSRRAVWFASLKADTPEAEFNEILSGASPYLPVRKFLERIYIEPARYRKEIKAAGFSGENSIVKTATDRQKLYSLFKAIKPEIVANAAREREDYLAYLKSSGVFDQKKIGLVDVGWTGSVMKYTRALVNDIDGSMELFGYFIGVGSMAKKKYGFSKGTWLHGYLFDFDDDTHREILKSFYVVEKFLSPNQPSLIKMMRDHCGFRPVYQQGPQEVSPLNFIVQNNALRFVRDHAQAAIPDETFDTATFLPALKKLLVDPDPGVARLLSQYSYSSDFGYQAGARPIARSRSASTYLRRPLLLFKDYRRARWKAGFVAQQPLPARVVLTAVCKIRLDRGVDRVLLWSRRIH